MSKTIFCTFDQQDLADLAIGHLRSEISGIHSIEYHTSGGAASNRTDDFVSFPIAGAVGPGQGVNAPGIFAVNLSDSRVSTGATPSRPASVRIVCDDGVANRVTSRLANLHGYRITSI